MAQGTPSTVISNPRRFRWRRLVQYRLRTLLILTTIIAVLLGWWSHKSQRQSTTVAGLTKAGLVVGYDFEDEHLEHPRYWPASLVDTLGVDYFATVTRVSTTGGTGDKGLEHLETLNALQALDLRASELTDAGLVHLIGLSHLKTLFLDNNSSLTDAGIKHLEKLNSLRVLYLYRTQVTAEGVARLQKALPNCEIVH